MNLEKLPVKLAQIRDSFARFRLPTLVSRWPMIVGLILLFWTVSPAPERSHSQTPSPGEAASVEVVSTMLPNGAQQIVVIDTQQKSMAVYQVEPNQGKIQLRSVRRLVWDLQMEEFNGQTPLPSELRKVQP
ncbi:MAG: hypothetical protein AB8B50_11250 [Pirellulaceae bacterium]